jgi:nitric oxide reductase NorQ protein
MISSEQFVERLSAADYRAPENLIYNDVLGLHSLYDRMAFRANVILVGPKGIGKSLSVASYAAIKKAPLITFDCSEDIRRSHLLGTFILRGDSTPFVLGPLTSAFEVANEAGQCVLILEECNALAPQSQKLLNAATDFRRKIEVPEAKRVFRLEKHAKLWIVGTMNESAYGGVYALNEDLKSRFRMIQLGYLDRDQEEEVLRSLLGKKMESLPVDKVLTLAQETRQHAIEYPMSTRDVVQVLEDIDVMGPKDAFRGLMGKFEGEDQKTVQERIKSLFGKI